MASQLRVQAAFTKMIPLKHPYMATFLEYQSDFGGANRVLVALKNKKGEIYEKDFMEKLRKVTEEVFFVKGVERSSVTSLFSPNVRYNEVVEDGFRGGNIVAADFAGTQEQLRLVRENLLKSDWVGRIVSNDQTVRDGGRDADGERSRDRRTSRPAADRRRAREDPRQVRRRRTRRSTSSASPRRWATSRKARPVCSCSSASRS